MRERLAGTWLARYPVALVCLALSLLFGAGIVWRVPMVEATEERLLDLEREWRQIQINSERALGLEGDIEALKGALGRVEERLIDAEEVALNYEFFLRMEGSSGVSLEAFSQDPVSPNAWKLEGDRELGLFRVIPFTLEVVGNYTQIVECMLFLQGHETLTRIGFVSIDRFKDKTGSVRLKAKIVCHQLGKKDE